MLSLIRERPAQYRKQTLTVCGALRIIRVERQVLVSGGIGTPKSGKPREVDRLAERVARKVVARALEEEGEVDPAQAATSESYLYTL